MHYGRLQYLVQWLGFPVTDNEWLGAKKMQTSEKAVTRQFASRKTTPSRENEKIKRGLFSTDNSCLFSGFSFIMFQLDWGLVWPVQA